MIFTKFIKDKRVGLYSFTEFVGFTADENGHIVCLGYERHLGAAHARHHIAVSEQSMRTQHHFGYLEIT